MKYAPTIYALRELFVLINSGNTSSNDGKHYVPARPLGLYTIKNRVKCAWAVFTGKADAVVWPQDQ